MSLALPLAMRGQKTLPYEYGFENNNLSSEGWTRNSMSSNTNISSNAKRTGNYGFRFYYNADPQYLITPELSTTSSGVTVEFYYKTSSTYFQRTFLVGYSTTTTDVGAFTFGDEITASDADWTLFGQDFPAGTKYVAIKHENTSYGNLYLDDFSFEECSEFPTPKNLVMTTYTSSTATFDWTGRTGQDHWDIYYSTSDAAPDSGTTPQVSNTETKPYTLFGLTPGETYYAYVRGNYNNGEHYSDWSNACSFEVGCYTPTISGSMATCNQAYFSWIPVGSETSWQVVFSDQQGFDPDEVTPETVATQYYVKEELATGVTYYAHVRAVCGEGDYSDWSEEVSMTTECFAPSNLQESSVTPTTATLAWTQGSNESQWQISYSTTANFTPESGTIVTVNSRPYTLTGLTLNTQYYAYVRAVCGEIIYSDWSNICAFMPKYELTVGNGNNYNAYIPICTSAIDYTTKSQFIVPAADLADLLYANISKMTFYATSETGNMGTATFEVLIGELDDVTVFENYAFFDWSEMTTVYSGSLSISESKMEITLAAPYQYMGGDLLIGFAETASGSTSGYFGWYGAETIGYSAYGGYEMTAYGYSDYGRYKFMPKTTFSYAPGTAPTCLKPKNLASSNVGATSATLSWTNGGSESAWVIEYATDANFSQNAVTVNASTNPYTLTGLTPETTYYAHVKADCGGDDYSDWSNVCSFMPSAIAETTINEGSATSYYVPVYGSSTSERYVKSQFIIPSDDLSDLLNSRITKLTFYNSYSSAIWQDGVFRVYLAPTTLDAFASSNPVNWDELTEVYCGVLSVSGYQMEIVLGTPYCYTGGNLLVGFSETTLSSSNDFVSWKGVETEDYTSYYYISSNSRAKFLPKMTITYDMSPSPNCSTPTDLHASYTSNAAVLSWVAGNEETTWKLQYKAALDDNWSEEVTVENTPSYNLSNLLPSTDYVVRVKADCGEGSQSNWLLKSFKTRCTPESLPFEHNFDSDATGTSAGLPQCWTRVNDATTASYQSYPYVMSGDSYAHSTPNHLRFYRTTESSGAPLHQMAVLPEMDAPINSLILSFWAKASSSSYNKLSVGVMTDPDDATTFVQYQEVTIPTTYTEMTVNFENYVGSGRYIAISCDRGTYSRTFYVDDISVVVDNSCKKPMDLDVADITTTSAVFTWTPGGEVSNWQVQYKKTSDADWSESIAVSETASYTLINLTPATEYEARVRTVCGADDYSDWAAAETFTTDCDYVALPYIHDFDSDATGHVAPTCWHFSDGTYPYIYEGSSAHSGNHYLQIKKNSDNAAILVLPEINTDEHPINTLQLTFWARASQSTSYYDYLYAGVMTDPDDVTTFQYVQGASTNLSTTTYKKFELYFDNWSGEGKYIALRYSGTTTYYIDDIELSVAPTCMAPLELSSNTTYAHEAYIRWKTRKASQLDYQVSYSTDEDFDPADGTIVDVHFDSPLSGTMYRDYQLTCLDAETTYYFYVRTKCGENEYSDWSADYSSFSTDWACPAPYFNDIHPKHTVADISWYADPDDEWEFQYKEFSSEEWITPTDFSPIMGAELSLVYRLTGLTPDTEYDIRIRQHCGMYSCPAVDDGYSDWATDYFTTGSGCWYGTPWMCTSHLGTQAALNWRNDAEATRWQIRYRLDTEEEYPAENIVTTEVLPEASLQKYVVTGLQPNSTYYWEVRGYCDETHQGEWSSEDYFYTHSTDGYITVDKTHPYYEDFEEGMPADWGRMNLYNYDMDHYDTWECVNATSSTWEALPATKCISSCRENMSWASPGSMILMPAIHIDENATSAVLSFWSKDAYNASDARGTKMIWVNGNYLSTEYTAFDLGCVYQNSGKANYWRKCFVNLDDYIGQTVIIAFDYVVTHNYNNYDWWVDDVRVEVFDNVFGGGDEITEGNWNDPTMWGNGGSRSGGLPTADDNVLINAKVTIPEGFVAEANRIVLNLDTIAEVKYGNIFIADGGQLKVNDEVEVTMERAVSGYGRGGNGWYLIAPPVQEALKPESDSIAGVLENSYDLYSFDGSHQGEEWRNYKQDEDGFTFENGYGYLFANSASVSPSFKGTVMPSNQTKTVDLDFAATTFGGWNLVGNPFTCDAYFQDGRDFYRMNEGGTALALASGVIYPMEGVFVEADDEGQSVVFTTTEPTRGQGMNFSLRKANERSAEAIDRTRIIFGEGPNLGHLDLMADPNRLYIPMSGKELAVVSTQPVGELPLNFEAAANGTYTLDFGNETEGLMYCHLIDNLTGADVDLLQQPEYTFNARTNDYASRFRVVFASVCGDANDDDETFAFNSNGNWIIANEGRATLQVIDVNGRILSSEQINGCAETRINAAAGVYVMRLVNGEKVRTQKVVVR